MTLTSFRRCVMLQSLKAEERTWFPKWLAGYAKFHGIQAEDVQLPMDQNLVIAYLQSLRNRNVEAWRRLQATRAMELYHNVLLRTSSVDFLPIRTKLMELAAKEKADKHGSIGCIDLVPGEGSKGQIKQTAPDVIQQMQARLRLLHHPLSTERAYLGWMNRFLKHLAGRHPAICGESDIAEFLTNLALEGDVTASTQNQALSALLFYYEKVLGRDLAFINSVRAKSSEYRPLVLTKAEIAALFPHFSGASRLMFCSCTVVDCDIKNAVH